MNTNQENTTSINQHLSEIVDTLKDVMTVDLPGTPPGPSHFRKVRKQLQGQEISDVEIANIVMQTGLETIEANHKETTCPKDMETAQIEYIQAFLRSAIPPKNIPAVLRQTSQDFPTYVKALARVSPDILQQLLKQGDPVFGDWISRSIEEAISNGANRIEEVASAIANLVSLQIPNFDEYLQKYFERYPHNWKIQDIPSAELAERLRDFQMPRIQTELPWGTGVLSGTAGVAFSIDRLLKVPQIPRNEYGITIATAALLFTITYMVTKLHMEKRDQVIREAMLGKGPTQTSPDTLLQIYSSN